MILLTHDTTGCCHLVKWEIYPGSRAEIPDRSVN